MRRAAAPLLAGILSLAVVLVAYAQQGNIPPPDPGCPGGLISVTSQNYPTNGVEPDYPIWCYAQPQAGAATRILQTNGWVDTWDNTQPAIQTLNDGDYDYRVFPRLLSDQSNFRVGTFINTDHWMLDLVDVSPFNLSGGILVSPNRRFQFESGRLVVEADAAEGADGMGGADHYYELDVSGADAPTPWVTDALYGYGQFGGIGAMGCRLENPALVCAMYDSSNRVTGGECPNDGRVCTSNGGRPGRVWETQGVGTANTASSVQGGYGEWPVPNGGGLRVRDVMRACGTNIHDYHCRDRFRMELTRDSVHLYANGYAILLIDGLYASNPATGADNRIPQAWLDNGARFYMTSWINSGQHAPLRWHWNDVRVNPKDASGNPAAPSAAPSWCLGNNLVNANGTISPNTCPHNHLPNQPEIGPLNGTPQPTSVPPTALPATATATTMPAATATATSVPPTSTSVPATPVPSTATPVVVATATPEHVCNGNPNSRWCR